LRERKLQKSNAWERKLRRLRLNALKEKGKPKLKGSKLKKGLRQSVKRQKGSRLNSLRLRESEIRRLKRLELLLRKQKKSD
jgi:hypothetical protein